MPLSLCVRATAKGGGLCLENKEERRKPVGRIRTVCCSLLLPRLKAICRNHVDAPGRQNRAHGQSKPLERKCFLGSIDYHLVALHPRKTQNDALIVHACNFIKE